MTSRRVLALVLAPGLLLGLAACSGDDADPGATTDDSTAVSTADPTVDATPTGPPPDFSTLEPTDPTKKQQQAYLDGRVPEGMDPQAVLEAGVEACDRMHYLATVDADTLVDALREGTESTDWPDAITYLCPDLAPYAAEAGL